MSTPPTVTRFWLLVDRREPDECWPWTGYIEDGYGRFFDGERMRFAHDLALEWWSGERRLDHLVTCHGCSRPDCVNPAHLRFDTPASNVGDMMLAGTHRTPRKLTDDDVLTIRARAAGGATGRRLAQQYGVSESLVTEIIRGNRRKTVGGPIRVGHGNSRKAHANG